MVKLGIKFRFKWLNWNIYECEIMRWIGKYESKKF